MSNTAPSLPWLAQYPASVPAQLDYSAHHSVVEVLEEAFSAYADRTAFWCMGKGLTYSELDAASAQFASYLQGIGLSKGARVAIMLPNLPQYPVALYGIMRAGYVVVSINPQYTAHELELGAGSRIRHNGLRHPDALVVCVSARAEPGVGAADPTG